MQEAALSAPETILIWNGQWDLPPPIPAEAPAGAFTRDRAALPAAAAVVFHLPSAELRELPDPADKRPGQLWVAWSQECDLNYARQRDPAFMGRFDLRMTYHQDADVFAPYLYPSMEEALRRPRPAKEPGCLVAAFISSGCDQSGRVGYLRELMQHMDVHCYGRLFRTHRVPGEPRRGPLGWLARELRGKLSRVLHLPSLAPSTPDQAARTRSKIQTVARYRFTLAFENACAPDYVTEKLYDPLLAGSVPVYLGAPNVAEYAPGEGCLVNVADHPSPAALARHLQEAGADESLYLRYHAWRQEPFQPAFARMLDRVRPNLFVRLQEAVARARGHGRAPTPTAGLDQRPPARTR